MPGSRSLRGSNRDKAVSLVNPIVSAEFLDVISHKGAVQPKPVRRLPEEVDDAAEDDATDAAPASSKLSASEAREATAANHLEDDKSICDSVGDFTCPLHPAGSYTL